MLKKGINIAKKSRSAASVEARKTENVGTAQSGGWVVWTGTSVATMASFTIRRLSTEGSADSDSMLHRANT